MAMDDRQRQQLEMAKKAAEASAQQYDEVARRAEEAKRAAEALRDAAAKALEELAKVAK